MAILDASNADIINKVRANASMDFRSRVPVTTKANLAKTLSEIQDYEPLWNEFQSVLINKIGLVLMDTNLVFENKLKPLKSGGMQYGGMVQELGTRFIDAEAYDPNATNVWDAQKPYVDANYHKINRRDKYKFKVNSDLLEEAFINDGQLSAYVNSLMVLPQQSAEWDEFLLMKELLASYNADNAMPNIKVGDLMGATTDEDKAAIGKELVEYIRAAYGYMKGFPRTDLNPEHVVTMSPDLVLITTPSIIARMDVEVLAAAFHMDKTSFLADRVVEIDHWPAGLEGTQALLVDGQFYRVFETKRRNVNIFNPDTLDWIYTYHIWQILSVSHMKNVMRFSTDETNVAIDGGTFAAATPASVSITTASDDGEFVGGDEVQIGATVTYSDGTTDANAYYLITGVTADGAAKAVIPDTGTYIDRMGVLHVSNPCEFKTLVIEARATDDPTKYAKVTLVNTALKSATASTDGE